MREQHRLTRRKHQAFTLVELLVVIGIIALLVAVLLPALNKAQATAVKIQCSSNIRQLLIAQNLYMETWKCYTMQSMTVVRPSNGLTANLVWQQILNAFMKWRPVDIDGIADVKWKGLVCPAVNTVPASLYSRSYVINTNISRGRSTGDVRGKANAIFRKPMVLILDGLYNKDSGAVGPGTVNPNSSGVAIADYGRHGKGWIVPPDGTTGFGPCKPIGGSLVVGFTDGHVEVPLVSEGALDTATNFNSITAPRPGDRFWDPRLR